MLEPALELGRARYEESLQQITPIERERVAGPSGVECRLECGRVAPDDVAAQPDFAVAARRDRFVAERGAQDIESLVQRRTRVGCI